MGSIGPVAGVTRFALDKVQNVLPERAERVVAGARDEDVLLYAGSLAFYALVSVAPLVIATMWVTSLFMADQEVKEAARTLGEVAPKSLGADKALERVAELGTSVGIAAFAGALWPASAYGAGLTRAFDAVSKSRKRRDLKGLKGRGLALVVILPLFVLGGLGGSYLGASVLDSGILRIVGYFLALVGGFGGVALAATAIYLIFPPETPSLGAAARGGAIAAIGISLLSLIFTIYLGVGADFQKHYATSGIAGIVLLGVWLYASNALLLACYKVVEEVERGS